MKTIVLSSVFAACVCALGYSTSADAFIHNSRAGADLEKRHVSPLDRRGDDADLRPPHLINRIVGKDKTHNANAPQWSLAKRRAVAEINQKAALGQYKYAVNLVDSFPVNMTAGGGATLHADATYPTPNPANPSEKFPLVVFPNSRGTPEIEYILKILNISTTGYVCVEYETRGWYDSTGEINTAGPFDRSDGSELITYIVNNYADAWRIDTNNIAFGGISYGAGISLLMAGYDARVKTAVALSGWGNLTTSLYHNKSPSKKSIHSLIDTAKRDGHPSPELLALPKQLLDHVNMSLVVDFGNSRSADAYLSAYKARDTPIFMSNNYLDRYFDPQGNTAFWTSIDVTHKFLLLNNGPHSEAEVFGVTDTHVHNYIWSKAQLWLDAILKGIDNGILTEPRVQMQHGNSIFSSDYNFYNDVPAPYASLHLAPRTGLAAGSVAGGLVGDLSHKNKAGPVKQLRKSNAARPTMHESSNPSSVERLNAVIPPVSEGFSKAARDAVMARALAALRREELSSSARQSQAADHEKTSVNACSPLSSPSRMASVDVGLQNTIKFSPNVTLNQGSDMWRALGFPSTYKLAAVDPSTTLVFVSDAITAGAELCGFPLLKNVTVIPKLVSTGAPSTQFQLYFYLYTIDDSCTGTIISDGLYTRWYDDTEPVVNPATGAYTLTDLEMRAICVSIPAGSRIGLAAVLYNPDFQGSTTDLAVTFDYSTNPSLTLPFF